jgi:hypothetical protein
LHLLKLITKKVLVCAYCSQEIEAGEVHIRVKGTPEETQGLSGHLHFSCFVHWFTRLPAK